MNIFQNANLDWHSSLRDPIWNEIPITEVESKIIRTQIFQRLRGIKQLSFVYLSFPSAIHTRFEHSIGTMHATDQLLKLVDAKKLPVNIDSRNRQILRLAALLHDIGHPPFSHAIEHLFISYPHIIDKLSKNDDMLEFDGKHEFYSKKIIISNCEIYQIVKEWERPQHLTRNEKALDLITASTIKIVANLAVGSNPDPDDMTVQLENVSKIFKSLVSGDVDADKLDYIMRDNYYCGLPYKLDISSLRNKLIIDRDGIKIQKSAMTFVENLLLARYRLAKEVHQDKWDKFATAKIIERLDSKLDRESDLAATINKLHEQWNDTDLIHYLHEGENNNNINELNSVLTTQYPLAEVMKLTFEETHPSIRGCVKALSEHQNRDILIDITRQLRTILGSDNVFIDIYGVKPAEFSMAIYEGGDILDDLIIRGILEESIKSFGIIVYGDEKLFQKCSELTEDELRPVAASNSISLPCDSCKIYKKNCIDPLCMGAKKILAQLVVGGYRQIIERIESKNHKNKKLTGYSAISSIDLIMTVLEKLHHTILEYNETNQEKKYYPTRQQLYSIIHELCIPLKLEVDGNVIDVKKESISNSFHLELRKYDQMGLISSIRETQPVDYLNTRQYLFDRRYTISDYGKTRIKKIRAKSQEGSIFIEYVKLFDHICSVIEADFDGTISKYLSTPHTLGEFPSKGSTCNSSNTNCLPKVV